MGPMAKSVDFTRTRPETLHLFGHALHDSGAWGPAIELLRAAQIRYPDDWWINNLLGWYCLTDQPPQGRPRLEAGIRGSFEPAG